jgi:hypothetical protein
MTSPRKSARNPITGQDAGQPRYPVDLHIYSPRSGDQLSPNFDVYVGCTQDGVTVTPSSDTGATAPSPGQIEGGSYTGTFVGASPGDGYTVTVTGDQANPDSVSDITILGPASIGIGGPTITIADMAPVAHNGRRPVTVQGSYHAALFYEEPTITVQLESPPGRLIQLARAQLNHDVLTPAEGDWTVTFPMVDTGGQGKGKHYSIIVFMDETLPIVNETVTTAQTSKGYKAI